VEQEHRFVKRRVNPGLGFGSFDTARRTLQGDEAMPMIRKGQLQGSPKPDVLAQNRAIAQMFGLVA
jgi:transposase, IS6 family